MGRRVSVRRVVERAARTAGCCSATSSATWSGWTRRPRSSTLAPGLVEVPLALVAAARLVPPSTADELALEGVAARGLAGRRDRPSSAAGCCGPTGGFTRRANSVLPLRAAAAAARRGARAGAARGTPHRGLPLRFQVPLEARRLLDAELAERGWPAEPARPRAGPPLDLAPTPHRGRRRARGRAGRGLAAPVPRRRGPGRRRPGAAHPARPRRVRLGATATAARSAIGRGAVDDGWLGVTAVEVAPALPPRRAGPALIAARCWAWGAAHGADRSYLQVDRGQRTPALALYARLGYRPHHDYHYRRSRCTTLDAGDAAGPSTARGALYAQAQTPGRTARFEGGAGAAAGLARSRPPRASGALRDDARPPPAERAADSTAVVTRHCTSRRRAAIDVALRPGDARPKPTMATRATPRTACRPRRCAGHQSPSARRAASAISLSRTPARTASRDDAPLTDARGGTSNGSIDGGEVHATTAPRASRRRRRRDRRQPARSRRLARHQHPANRSCLPAVRRRARRRARRRTSRKCSTASTSRPSMLRQREEHRRRR